MKRWWCGIFLFYAVVGSGVLANDFPTLDRVSNILTCMKKHGGQSLDNLYSCSCAIDAIADQMSFSEWEEATIYSAYRRMPGEKGGVFRGSEKGEEVTANLREVEAKAEKRCFIGVRRKVQKAE